MSMRPMRPDAPEITIFNMMRPLRNKVKTYFGGIGQKLFGKSEQFLGKFR
jgi:hypothetical protein